MFIEKEKVQICQKLFKSIYGVTQRRLNIIAQKLLSGKTITEQRGGDKRSSKYTEKLVAVKKFISVLNGKDSHYGRQKSKRIYVSPEYNISNLWQLYNEKAADNLKVNYKYFSRVFNTHFNIGFGSPATDVCGFCVRTTTQIHNAKQATDKQNLTTQLKVHKVRAAQFHKLMKEHQANTWSFCFDLQQIQVLPKVPIQEAFYAQQLSLYFFCIVGTDCKKPLFYTWLEHEAGRGATEISSALLHFLKTLDIPPNITCIRLFADGCGGQNKNSFVVHMLMLWLYRFAPTTVHSIVLIFPIRGHSYLPADRIFGRVEKILRQHSTIKTPEKYYELYLKVGEIRRLGTEWSLYDIKSASVCLKKINGISQCRRIYIKRGPTKDKVFVKTEVLYRSDDTTKKFETLLKARKRLQQIEIPELPLNHKIKKKKLDSLKALLVSLAGENWSTDPELTWMTPIFSEHCDEENTTADNDEKLLCECNDDEEENFI